MSAELLGKSLRALLDSQEANEEAEWASEWAKGAEAWKERVEPPHTLLIVAFSERSREVCHLRLQEMVDKKLPGHNSKDWATGTCPDEGLGRDIMEISEEQMGRAVGTKGANMQRVRVAAHCALEYFGQGQSTFAVFAGTALERARGQQYLQWILSSPSKGGRRITSLTAEDLQARDDLSILPLTAEENTALEGDTLRAIEAESSTAMYFREISDAELFPTGSYITISRGGRTFQAEVVESAGGNKAGEPFSLNFSMKASHASLDTAEQLQTEQLLIFGFDEGPTGQTGRRLAMQKVREFLDSKRQSSTSAEATQERSQWTAPPTGADKSWQDNSWNKWKSPAPTAATEKRQEGSAWTNGDWAAAKTRPDDSSAWGNWTGRASKEADNWGSHGATENKADSWSGGGGSAQR
eukprot:CAMPEP_0197697296 /NCGR_PEP_ID=MMETSP1338-20131121/117769_1 /TAXON_ID=43686 ORGANISM="Pelagodinium beii, Strain RCC1491" /NCGR_SAMPLE_ID=MMETSP1338 /ASSEMBLY_ACC=CAM_ASM_000754 /LENGTH=410 /DNA_ID=CAMNT_0043280539 /DNA_START=53 /DNA_END=1282 /DNA_ORIENTATION=+